MSFLNYIIFFIIIYFYYILNLKEVLFSFIADLKNFQSYLDRAIKIYFFSHQMQTFFCFFVLFHSYFIYYPKSPFSDNFTFFSTNRTLKICVSSNCCFEFFCFFVLFYKSKLRCFNFKNKYFVVFLRRRWLSWSKATVCKTVLRAHGFKSHPPHV